MLFSAFDFDFVTITSVIRLPYKKYTSLAWFWNGGKALAMASTCSIVTFWSISMKLILEYGNFWCCFSSNQSSYLAAMKIPNFFCTSQHGPWINWSVVFWYRVSSNPSSQEAALEKDKVSLAHLPTLRLRAWTVLCCHFITAYQRNLFTNRVSSGVDFVLVSPIIWPSHKTKRTLSP